MVLFCFELSIAAYTPGQPGAPWTKDDLVKVTNHYKYMKLSPTLDLTQISLCKKIQKREIVNKGLCTKWYTNMTKKFNCTLDILKD